MGEVLCVILFPVVVYGIYFVCVLSRLPKKVNKLNETIRVFEVNIRSLNKRIARLEDNKD